MAMRYVYHLTVDGAFLGPGSMFVFASALSLVAAGCAYALPKNRADSRPSTRASLRASMSDIHYEDTETEGGLADATTPFMRDGISESSSGSYGTSRGTEML